MVNRVLNGPIMWMESYLFSCTLCFCSLALRLICCLLPPVSHMRLIIWAASAGSVKFQPGRTQRCWHQTGEVPLLKHLEDCSLAPPCNVPLSIWPLQAECESITSLAVSVKHSLNSVVIRLKERKNYNLRHTLRKSVSAVVYAAHILSKGILREYMVPTARHTCMYPHL